VPDNFLDVLFKAPTVSPSADFASDVRKFKDFGQKTRSFVTKAVGPDGKAVEVAIYVNEFWTAKQRAAHSLHEISYRACFKPQLPRFFIERLTQPGEVVYDPFMGRGTTIAAPCPCGSCCAIGGN
jgi:tRNA G10  N-methylase Trm11